MKSVFITGGSGYIGKRLIGELLSAGYHVIALVRKGSQAKIPQGAEIIIADPFDAWSFQHYIPEDAVFVQLLGVSHPSPKKAQLFQQIDLISVVNSAKAARQAGVSHFIYVSVAMEPTSVMQAYQEVRKEGEEYCINSGLQCTFIRPWYVLGPGHWWPVMLLPLYTVARFVPSLKNKAAALGLVTIQQMVRTLTKAVISSPQPLTIIEIPVIKLG